MKDIHVTLKERLRAVGRQRWEAIAQAAGCAPSTPKKVLERANPGVNTIQPLLDYFDEVDRGVRRLPPLPEKH